MHLFIRAVDAYTGVSSTLLGATSAYYVSGPYLELGLRHDSAPGYEAFRYNNDRRLNSNTTGEQVYERPTGDPKVVGCLESA